MRHHLHKIKMHTHKASFIMGQPEEVPHEVIQYEVNNIRYVPLLLKTFNLNLIMWKEQMNPECTTFYEKLVKNISVI